MYTRVHDEGLQISLRVTVISDFRAFMPCITVVAYRVLQVFHYHSIYIFLVDIVIIRDH